MLVCQQAAELRDLEYLKIRSLVIRAALNADTLTSSIEISFLIPFQTVIEAVLRHKPL